VKRKIDIVKELISKKEYKKALKIIKTFRVGLTKDEKDQITRGYECYNNHVFYEQLGFNKDEEISKSIEIITNKF